MQVTFLGTSSGVPTRSRNVSAVAVRLPQRPEIWLFDCGEGTQHQFLKSDLRLSQLQKVFISHMHGDHIFGLPGLMASLGLAGQSKGLELYGPDPLKGFVNGVLQSSSSRIGYPLKINRVRDEAENNKILIEDQDLSVRCISLNHRIPAYAYRIQEKTKPGTFDIKKARALNIPPGPNYASLKSGKTIKLEDGRVFNGKEFSGSQTPGRSLVYCTDTVFTENAIKLSRGANLLIHEATFSHIDAELAYKRGHSTSTMAAQVALEAGVEKLVLTHISPRYAPGNKTTTNDLLKEARTIFPNTFIAKDFLQIEVK